MATSVRGRVWAGAWLLRRAWVATVVALAATALAGCPEPVASCSSGLPRRDGGGCPGRCAQDPRLVCDEDGAVIPGWTLDAAGFDVPGATDDAADAAADAVVCDGGTVCAGSCASLADDANNCGACGRACPGVVGGVPTCGAGVCGFACAAGFGRVGGGCDAVVPRQVAPISGAIVASRVPRFSWSSAPGGDAGILEICSDPVCAHVIATVESTTAAADSPRVLGPGVWFWRLRGRTAGAVSTLASPIWEVSVGIENRPTGATIGFTVDFNRDGLA
ncbi:MAG: hypothetical protein WCJ30_21270, partial [Deltaproteobacteria bacterium]